MLSHLSVSQRPQSLLGAVVPTTTLPPLTPVQPQPKIKCLLGRGPLALECGQFDYNSRNAKEPLATGRESLTQEPMGVVVLFVRC